LSFTIGHDIHSFCIIIVETVRADIAVASLALRMAWVSQQTTGRQPSAGHGSCCSCCCSKQKWQFNFIVNVGGWSI